MLKKMFLPSALAALMLGLVLTGCSLEEKRTPTFTAEITPIVEIEPISVSVKLDCRPTASGATTTTESTEKRAGATFRIKITDKKKDVIWRIKTVSIRDYGYFYAEKLNSSDNSLARIEIDYLIQSSWLYDDGIDGYISEADLSRPEDIVKKSSEVTLSFVQGHKLLSYGRTTAETRYAKNPTVYDNPANSSWSEYKYDGFVTENGKMKVKGKVYVLLETINGAQRYVYVPITIEIESHELYLEKSK